MWNGAGSFAGNAWGTPTGGGLKAMLNAMRAALNEPIYVVVAATGGTGLQPNDITLTARPPVGWTRTQDCAGPDIYTEDGQLGLPITPA